jgi:hypothetical protein
LREQRFDAANAPGEIAVTFRQCPQQMQMIRQYDRRHNFERTLSPDESDDLPQSIDVPG